MPTRDAYKQGTPSWVDLQTTDVNGAKAFYGALFGWTFDDQEIPGGGGPYAMSLKNGKHAAAITAQSPPMVAAGVPPMWNTYLAVDDVDATAARVAESGGQLAMPAMDVMDAGRMAFAMDPTGAAFGMWQAKQHIGAEIVNEPGALIWNELVSDDVAKASAFYEKVLSVTAEESEMGGNPYTLFKVDGEMVAGATGPMMPGIPNHWGVYFCVEDTKVATQKVAELGGTVVVEPFETPIGMMAIAKDPQGAYFSLFSPGGQAA